VNENLAIVKLAYFLSVEIAKIVCEADHIAFWGQNERKIDSLISEMLVQKASDISACVMYLCKEQMFPL